MPNGIVQRQIRSFAVAETGGVNDRFQIIFPNTVPG